MGRASNRKWDRRYEWKKERFLKLRHMRDGTCTWRYIVYQLIASKRSLMKSITEDIYKEPK